MCLGLGCSGGGVLEWEGVQKRKRSKDAPSNAPLCFDPPRTALNFPTTPSTNKPQYLAVDGRRVLALDIPKTGLEDNFTRAYYTCSGRVILSGACFRACVVCLGFGVWVRRLRARYIHTYMRI